MRYGFCQSFCLILGFFIAGFACEQHVVVKAGGIHMDFVLQLRGNLILGFQFYAFIVL